MRIEISGHHVDITDAIRNAITSKLEKIESHYPQIDLCSVTFTVERNSQIAELKTQYLGTTIAVEAKNHDLYTAMAEAVKKFDAKLGHKKGMNGAHRHEKVVLDDLNQAEPPV